MAASSRTAKGLSLPHMSPVHQNRQLTFPTVYHMKYHLVATVPPILHLGFDGRPWDWRPRAEESLNTLPSTTAGDVAAVHCSHSEYHWRVLSQGFWLGFHCTVERGGTFLDVAKLPDGC